jgi:uncharacterized protein (TIGR02147 family)
VFARVLFSWKSPVILFITVANMKTTETHHDYRQTLKKVFGSRREKNPSYSLRSFARDLSVSPSMLSDVLNHKKSLTRKSAAKINTALKLSKTDSELFLLSIDLEQPSALQPKEDTLVKIEKHSSMGRTVTVNADHFAYISDYRHLVVMALFGVKGFRYNLAWIAGKIGAFQFQVKDIFKRLQKLGVIRFNSKNEPELQKDFVLTQDNIPSEAIRSYHRSTLHQALDAIEGVPVAERDYTSYLFAIDQDDFPKMQKEIRDFQKQLYARYAQKPSANRVYAVQTQIIPFTSRCDL